MCVVYYYPLFVVSLERDIRQQPLGTGRLRGICSILERFILQNLRVKAQEWTNVAQESYPLGVVQEITHSTPSRRFRLTLFLYNRTLATIYCYAPFFVLIWCERSWWQHNKPWIFPWKDLDTCQQPEGRRNTRSSEFQLMQSRRCD